MSTKTHKTIPAPRKGRRAKPFSDAGFNGEGGPGIPGGIGKLDEQEQWALGHCEFCGQLYYHPVTGARRKYCSKSCKEKAYRRRKKGKKPRPDPELLECNGCGKKFKKSGAPGPLPRWCSNACRQRAYRQRKQAERSPG
jgi:hypothetical protein